MYKHDTPLFTHTSSILTSNNDRTVCIFITFRNILGYSRIFSWLFCLLFLRLVLWDINRGVGLFALFSSLGYDFYFSHIDGCFHDVYHYAPHNQRQIVTRFLEKQNMLLQLYLRKKYCGDKCIFFSLWMETSVKGVSSVSTLWQPVTFHHRIVLRTEDFALFLVLWSYCKLFFFCFFWLIIFKRDKNKRSWKSWGTK